MFHIRGTVSERTGNYVREIVYHPYDYLGVTVEISTDYAWASPSAASELPLPTHPLPRVP